MGNELYLYRARIPSHLDLYNIMNILGHHPVHRSCLSIRSGYNLSCTGKKWLLFSPTAFLSIYILTKQTGVILPRIDILIHRLSSESFVSCKCIWRNWQGLAGQVISHLQPYFPFSPSSHHSCCRPRASCANMGFDFRHPIHGSSSAKEVSEPVPSVEPPVPVTEPEHSPRRRDQIGAFMSVLPLCLSSYNHPSL